MGDADGPGRVVGLVGAVDDTAATLRRTIDGDDEVVAADAATVLAADPSVVVAVGEAAALSVARDRPDAPILPVDAGHGFRSIPHEAIARALDRRGTDEWQTITHPLVSVGVDDQVATALLDATLVTAEPAQISEFTIRAGGETVATVRADGVVVATPAGTCGYARAVGTPVVAPGSGVFAVAPIAPFETDPDSWILPDDGLTVTTTREETPVSVLADDREIGTVGVDEPLRIERTGTIQTVVVPASTSPFERGDAELEKH